MVKSINGATLKKMIMVGATFVDNAKDTIDSLNVFPVNDGDTGINQAMTLRSCAKEVSMCTTNELEAVSEAISRGALKGARGNSGVILSQILKGISNVLAESQVVTTKVFAKALQRGSEIAYKAVTKPKEGTMLTIIRTLAESATNHSKKIADFEEFLDKILEEGEEMLQKTPDMLPVLKKAGVVDAGGRGLIVFFTGFRMALSDDAESFVYNFEDNIASDANAEFHANLEELEEIEFGYCTEFMVIQIKPTATESDIDKLRDKLLKIGDCVICVGDLSLVKVHVHTNEPNKALGYGLELGELYNLKIENMVEQNRVLKNQSNITKKEFKPFGMVAVSPGVGISALLSELQVDYMVRGGQTVNPSADDIASAVMKVNAHDVFVFPNNKNIILAAEQAKDLVQDRTIHVIPTTSVPEGIASCMNFNPEATLEENMEAMTAALESVTSGAVTYAVRSINIDTFDVNEGDIIGLDNSHILTKSNNIKQCTLDLLEKLLKEDSYSITLFQGDGVKESEAEELKNEIAEKYPNIDVNLYAGGQPVYYYIISIE